MFSSLVADPAAQGEQSIGHICTKAICSKQVAFRIGAVGERDPTRYGYPAVEGEALEGGLRYSVIGPNSFSAILTPHHLGTWADQQIFNALTRGVRPSGRQLHGSMPFRIYKAMDHEELYSIIACLRSPTVKQKDPYVFESATGHSFKGQGYR